MLDVAHAARVRPTEMEKQHGIPRAEIAKDCVYWSHETFTCAQGGCAKAETDALECAFGTAGKSSIMLANTKGFTGHPMGVGFEGAFACTPSPLSRPHTVSHACVQTLSPPRRWCTTSCHRSPISSSPTTRSAP
jgi:hypothetical protein